MPQAAGMSYLRPPEERLRVPLDLERDPLDFEREPERLPRDRAGDFFAGERLVAVELLAGAAVGAGASVVGSSAAAGVAGFAAAGVAAAARVRPPATETRGWKPSSARAISAPTAIMTAAARPRKMPIFRFGEPAIIRQRIRSTARTPSCAVTAPRRTGTFTLCPAAPR